MRVLFVDDEEMILAAIQRTLFHRCDDWQIECVLSGDEALEELAEEDYDVVVSDMRMPGMDGATLLSAVQDRYPHIVRIILSGYAELEATIRSLRVTHQFLSKPCEPKVIEQVISRAVELQSLLASPSLRSAVGEISSLPSLPRVYAELTTALARDTCDLDVVSGIVSQDPAMSAKLLQLVNSSFFTRGAIVADVRQAVLRLGFEMVKNLALAVEVFSVGKLPRVLRERLSFDAVHDHAMATAVLARSMFDDPRLASDAFTAAILQDVGLLALAAEVPDRLAGAFEVAEAEGIARHEAEQRTLGASHADVGAYLLGTWGLPYSIVGAVAHHHTPERLETTGFGVSEAVFVASELVAGRDLDPAYVELLGVGERLDQWRDRAGCALKKAS